MSQQENLSGRSNKDWLLQASGILTWSLVSYVLLVNFSGWQDRIIAGIALVTFMALFLRVTLSNTKMSINQFLLLLLVPKLIVNKCKLYCFYTSFKGNSSCVYFVVNLCFKLYDAVYSLLIKRYQQNTNNFSLTYTEL